MKKWRRGVLRAIRNRPGRPGTCTGASTFTGSVPLPRWSFRCTYSMSRSVRSTIRHHQFVADRERAFHLLPAPGPSSCKCGLIELLFELQRRAFVRRHLAHVFEVLPVDAAPGHARVGLLHGDVAHRRLDLGRGRSAARRSRCRLRPSPAGSACCPRSLRTSASDVKQIRSPRRSRA